MIQDVLLLKDLMNQVDSSKRENLLNLQKEFSLKSDLKIESYVEGFSFNSFLGYFYRYSELESLLLKALRSKKYSQWLEKVKKDNHFYFLVDDPSWETGKVISDVQIDLVLIGEHEDDPVLEVNALL